MTSLGAEFRGKDRCRTIPRDGEEASRGAEVSLGLRTNFRRRFEVLGLVLVAGIGIYLLFDFWMPRPAEN